MSNPFLIEGPGVLQFSGGRTSGEMVTRCIEAHGGRLPADVLISFQNTGLEDERTLQFVDACESWWGHKVYRVEWRPDAPGFEEVGHNSMDRSGKWFSVLNRKRRFLPNSVARFCTMVLKVEAAKAFCLAQGWDTWTAWIGIRRDEEARYRKGVARNRPGKERYDSAWPLYDAGVRKIDVLIAWAGREFDLRLPDEAFGNCRLCHLKGREKLLMVMLADLAAADWWVEEEATISGMVAAGECGSIVVDGLFGEEEIPRGANAARFRRDGWTYRQMRDYVRDHRSAAQAEVDRFLRNRDAGLLQPDLLDLCNCGVG
jgi:hypothetical protein